ncbi:MAG: hypothetical protein GYA55_10650 [SAR324 cluster bacterium]|uniref:diacylglycerol kinase (ATP) n=1 Tax=SAR324 cluster bacterium TaxID=2024889 RepID=A0A7X9IKE3_9DELT|nr:hypothetical protein [SAR324 cluster bacterium]
MRTCFLVNPYSGGGKGKELIAPINKAIEELRLNAFISCIGEERDLEGLFLREGARQIVVVGGDGTFSSLLSFSLNNQVVLGMLPIGTGNDLAKEIGVFQRLSSKNIRAAISKLLNFETRELNIWKAGYGDSASREIFFCNYLSLGFDAVVMKSFNVRRQAAKPMKSTFGVLRNRWFYVQAAASNMSYTLPSGIKIEDEEHMKSYETPKSCVNILFPNIHSYMGLGISALSASPFDEKLPMVIFDSPLSYLKSFSKRYFGLPKDCSSGASNWRLRLGSSQVPMQVDGELVGELISGDLWICFAGNIKVLAL